MSKVVNIVKNKASISLSFTRRKKIITDVSGACFAVKAGSAAWRSFSPDTNTNALHLINVWILTQFSRAFQECKNTIPSESKLGLLKVYLKIGNYLEQIVQISKTMSFPCCQKQIIIWHFKFQQMYLCYFFFFCKQKGKISQQKYGYSLPTNSGWYHCPCYNWDIFGCFYYNQSSKRLIRKFMKALKCHLNVACPSVLSMF